MSDKEISRDEKFISIDYDTWVNKYQPLERENEELKRKVEDYQVKIEIVLGTHRYVNEYWTTVGYVEFDVKAGWNVRMTDLDRIKDEIRQISYTTSKDVFISKERSDELEKQYNKIADQQQEINNRIENLPSIIKWLFKLK
jgi:FtsZ-binding cell division protein ZapB